jgi:polyisoprenoid-binding protein YceI
VLWIWKLVALQFVAVMLPVLAMAVTARADVWVLDKASSSVHFSYDRFGLSRPWGRFTNLEGTMEFSPTDPEQGAVDITIPAAGLSTGVAELDQLLRSPDFFAANRHPKIRFKSTGVKKTGDKQGELDGELTMLGVTMPVTLQVTWRYTGEHPLSAINPSYQGKWVSGFSAKTTIERSKWGMKRGIPLLSDEVAITIEAEFVKAD